MKKFNVGVLGIGDISDVYIRNLKKYGIVNVVACAGRNLQKAQEKATAHAIAKAYATPAELVSDASVDIVLNLTLPAVHAELNMVLVQT
jgi:predicted dehydrogenase